MKHLAIKMFVVGFVILIAAPFCIAQGNNSPLSKTPTEDDKANLPKSYQEGLEKIRIDREKKEYDKMVGYGEEALKISEELEKAFESNGRLTEKELNKVANVEKLVKKIRNELGGDDDENDSEADLNKPVEPEKAVKTLRTVASDLFGELKKMTRFTISAAAIQNSNSLLRITRFLRLSK